MRLLPLLFLAACALDEPSFSETEQEVKAQPGDCPAYGCGTNSPETEGRPFWEQNELGVTNTDGIRLVRFTKWINGVEVDFRPDVFRAELLARDRTTNQVILSGMGVAGAVFTFEDTITQNRYYITIAGAAPMRMWASAPTAIGTLTWNYELTYFSDTNSTRRNLCKAAGQPTGDSMNPFNAVLFDDDRILPDDLVVDREEADWFTIGCAGSALAKLHLTGHTKAGSAIAMRPTTLPQRTAFLKLLTADYCGTGHAYTVANMELHYRDVSGTVNTSLNGEPVEALWGPNGAICVGTPRVEYSPNLLSWGLFGPSIRHERARFGCRLPRPCTTPTYSFGYNFGNAYAMSTNY